MGTVEPPPEKPLLVLDYAGPDPAAAQVLKHHCDAAVRRGRIILALLALLAIPSAISANGIATKLYVAGFYLLPVMMMGFLLRQVRQMKRWALIASLPLAIAVLPLAFLAGITAVISFEYQPIVFVGLALGALTIIFGVLLICHLFRALVRA